MTTRLITPTAAELARDNKSLTLRCAALETALKRIATVDETVTYHVVDKTLYACASTGRVQRLVSVGTFSETETTFAMQWQDVPSVPGMSAAIVEDALRVPAEGMACGDDEDALERAS